MSEPSSPAAESESHLSLFTLTMINVAAILAMHALPSLAEYGCALVFYLGAAALGFFIPAALISAELASGWEGEGGVYLWVTEAFGPKWGLVAIFMQWVENLPWFAMVLAFAASAFAYLFDPVLATNKWFVVAFIWFGLAISTLVNLRGLKFSAFLSTSGVLIGTIFPCLVIIALGAVYWLRGEPLALQFSVPAMLPDLENPQQLMLLAVMLVSFTGIEMSAVHVTEVKDAGKTYPRAIFISCGLIIILSMLAALSIALVIPADDVSLSAGVYQALAKFFAIFGMPMMAPIITFLVAYGAMVMVITWMIGPSKGIREAATEGYLPELWRKKNEFGIPVHVLALQAVVSGILSIAILFMPSVSSAFMLMNALAAQLYLIMYLLMFAAIIRLRYTHPHVKRSYQVPGGKVGIWLVAGIAILSSCFVFITGFIPTGSLRESVAGIVGYVGFLLVGCLVFTALPLWYFHRSGQRSTRHVQ
ncbi:APC family permease [Parendozoicomonas haliclonae]|uniref:Putative glutamate/gamma-aminobutyrate antiporter n=1 Tax=Parendozoicomonas haliclonae TaxID=1960125 RepID=A0A1X7AKR1_9GAMM|nr:APC family permease [Parendozoicomonas haliclonae]SMA48280.1 putative glutamate/gamma-aminobutyrate antiporter [Parendozoicomonas haliclonae]